MSQNDSTEDESKGYDPAELLKFFLEFADDGEEREFLRKQERDRIKYEDLIVESLFALNKAKLLISLHDGFNDTNEKFRKTIKSIEQSIETTKDMDVPFGYYILNEDTDKLRDKMKEYRGGIKNLIEYLNNQ